MNDALGDPVTAPDDDGRALAILAARKADDRQASDIVVLDVGDVLSITGYFVIASAPNGRLVRNVADEIELTIKEQLGRPPVRVEGLRESQWTLIDYGDVVVHVFRDDMREFYEIERLYGDVPRVSWNA
ncbi:ribosome silencing factor [Ilumatobacter coccineus]|jgi:ribosome-associated protein|uniref:ribosome silencing factor n=1 Tax=Ilumatobacter coccineus TaxID=467094 RepID=UPI00034575BB|nr:ribosome silencing factor [Ilumatobacter coccineus]